MRQNQCNEIWSLYFQGCHRSGNSQEKVREFYSKSGKFDMCEGKSEKIEIQLNTSCYMYFKHSGKTKKNTF